MKNKEPISSEFGSAENVETPSEKTTSSDGTLEAVLYYIGLVIIVVLGAWLLQEILFRTVLWLLGLA